MKSMDLTGQWIEGPALVAQTLRIRLQRQLGTWAWDLRKGVPWVQTVFTRPIDMRSISAALRLEILRTPGVSELTEFSLDRLEDRLDLRFTVTTLDGQTALHATGSIDPETPAALFPLGAVLLNVRTEAIL